MHPVELFTHCFSHHHQDDSESSSSSDETYHHHDRKRSSVPAVTLFYDADKSLTVAVLSKAIEPLSVYFQCRVEQGSALQRSILYYELDGYIRENYSKIHRQSGFGPEAISVAVGSLEASDEAQKKKLEEERRAAMERLHHNGENKRINDETFEKVMEIARLHRLNDDLDVLSVYFLRQVNTTCERIAQRIAQYQLSHTTLVLTPYVDGVALSGYSNFHRGMVVDDNVDENNSFHRGMVVNDNVDESNNTNVVGGRQEGSAQPRRHHSSHHRPQLVQHREFGREIEYRQCKDVLLTSSLKDPGVFSPTQGSDQDTAQFTWDCEEMTLAVMHRWWGDIAEREYFGQKLVLSWLLLPPSPSHSSSSSVATSLPLGTIHLEPSETSGANQRFSISLASRITLDILRSNTREVNDMTISYQGKARVCNVKFNFLALVRAAARHCLEGIRREYRHVEDSRPLLDHERSYLRQVQDAASL